MNKKYTLYVLLWLVIMIILSSDSFSYGATRKIIKSLFLYFDPNVSIRTILKFHEFVRKALHVINFAILSWLILCAWLQSARPISKWTAKVGIACVAICILYSISEEWRQSFSHVRTPRVLDIFLDAGGAILTQGICFVLSKTHEGSTT